MPENPYHKHREKGLNPKIELFETRDDLQLDSYLLPYDVLGSLAHAAVLLKVGILSGKEHAGAREGLLEALALHNEGSFRFEPGDEDMHAKLEAHLTARDETIGKKIQTGRSRNDQVLTAMRLFLKERLLVIEARTISLALACVSFAHKHEYVPMPGYTHMQRAMPSSVGMWAGSFAEALLDDVQLLRAVYAVIDQSPLGSAAGYGVPLPLDRNLAAGLLGFSKVQSNCLYCQNSRGKFEATVLSAFVAVLSNVNRLAADLLFFTTKECDFFKLAGDFYSGSSIMPQKNNLDVAELLRGKVKKILGYYLQIASLPLDLLSGYNRDLQDLKGPLIESVETTTEALEIADLVMTNLDPVKEKLKEACSPEIYATHKVLSAVSKGGAFRDAYRAISGTVDNLGPEHDPEEMLHAANHEGATGNLGLSRLQEQLQRELQVTFEKRTALDKTWHNLRASK